jgi:glycopeptide antibiotics resistance protein
MMIIDFDIFALIGLTAIFVLIGWYLKKKKSKSRTYLLFYGFFAVYLTALLSNTIFPLAYFGHGFPSNLWQSIHLIPSLGLLKLDSLLNLCMMIPLGCLVPLLWKIKDARAMLPAVLIPGLVIEFFQFLTGLASQGYTWRLIDINDYLSYSLGIALGYLIFRLVATYTLELFPERSEEDNITNFVWEAFDRSTPKPVREAFGDEGY